jgi:hypothetical protein
MLAMTPKRFHTFIALILLVCLICPFAEMIVHSDGCIFVSGHDTESTLALLVLIVELAFALGKLLFILLPGVLKKLSLVSVTRLALPILTFALILPDASPPLRLRI